MLQQPWTLQQVEKMMDGVLEGPQRYVTSSACHQLAVNDESHTRSRTQAWHKGHAHTHTHTRTDGHTTRVPPSLVTLWGKQRTEWTLFSKLLVRAAVLVILLLYFVLFILTPALTLFLCVLCVGSGWVQFNVIILSLSVFGQEYIPKTDKQTNMRAQAEEGTDGVHNERNWSCWLNDCQ